MNVSLPSITQKQQIAMRTARNSIGVNIALAAFKLFAGIFAQSAAMVADAVHSITDLVSTVVVIIGIRMAGKKPDKEHPYGHERFECVATLVLAVLISIVGIGIGWAGIQAIIARDFGEITTPGVLALVAAVISIGVKEGLFWYVRGAAKKIDSSGLMADAWHSRADGLSSIGSFVGILGARLGFPILDPVAAIIICLFILKTALNIAKDALGKMTDRACSDETEQEMRELITAHDGVKGIDRLNTRMFGNRIYVDVDICVDGTLSLKEAHDTAEGVHDAIERQFSKVKHCMVHVNPDDV
ncbi:MAG: cation diffusion facilitator family transporter [Defluviitaleaceae bacterium]|nr:cation diffusion facilitator family transporter [Defluviitaleaceae bacterium]